MDRSEGKAKKRFTGWLSQEKRESYLVNIMISLAFLILSALVILIASVMGRTERLQFENMVERSFNDVVFDLQQNSYTGYSPSFTDDVVGVGLYDASGSLIQSWGSVYNMLPVSSIASRSTEGGSDTLISYNPSTDVLEYIRFLRQPLALNSISFLSGGPAFSDGSLIMYMAFDGSHYMDRQKAIYFIAFLVLIGIILLYLFVMKLMKQNRDYKDQMAKQGNLVNLGQAARTLTHEIKNPLAAMQIYTSLLRKAIQSGKGIEKANEFIDIIEQETERLNEIAVDFLFAVKPMQVDLKMDSLNDIILELSDFVAVEAATKDIKITLRLDKFLPSLMLDRKLLRRAFLNIINNTEGVPDGLCRRGDAEEDLRTLLYHESRKRYGAWPYGRS